MISAPSARRSRSRLPRRDAAELCRCTGTRAGPRRRGLLLRCLLRNLLGYLHGWL